MIATLVVLLFVLLDGGAAGTSQPLAYHAARAMAARAIPAQVAPATMSLPSWSASPANAASQAVSSHLFLPTVTRHPFSCQPVPGAAYGTLSVNGPPTDRPAEQHADLNLSMRGYEITREHPIKGNGAVDLLAERAGECVAIEIETGKSDIKQNLVNVRNAGFDRVILVAASPSATAACRRAMDDMLAGDTEIELLTWLDVS